MRPFFINIQPKTQPKTQSKTQPGTHEKELTEIQIKTA